MNKTKKIVSLLLSGTIVLGIVTNYRSIVYAQDSDAPILYLEVSNTITAQDSFAWDTYDHINYIEPSYTQLNLPNHIILDGSNIKMMGYGEVAYKDFLLVEDDNDSRKILSFDIQRDSTDWHSMEGGGFLFDSSVKNGVLNGFCIMITQSGLELTEIKNADVEAFRNSRSEYVRSYGSLLKTYSIGDVYAEHHIKIEVDSSSISLWDGDSLIIDDYQLPSNNYGFGYGPITSHASHCCWQQSYFTFSNIKMETVTGYYIKLEPTEDLWNLTEDYWTNTFKLTTVEYTPSEDETIDSFDEYPLFKNAKDMVLFYPDETYEYIPWENGKADHDHSERYINVLTQNVNVGEVHLHPGEEIIGAYSE